MDKQCHPVLTQLFICSPRSSAVSSCSAFTGMLRFPHVPFPWSRELARRTIAPDRRVARRFSGSR